MTSDAREIIESIFTSSPAVDGTTSADDRYQRKPSGSEDQGYRDEN